MPSFHGKSTGTEDSTGFTASRIRVLAGTILKQADVSAITYKIFKKETLAEVASGTLVISAVVSDTLVTNDVRWNAAFPNDTEGYNVGFTLPASSFPEGTAYIIEVQFVETGGDQFFWRHTHTTEGVITPEP